MAASLLDVTVLTAASNAMGYDLASVGTRVVRNVGGTDESNVLHVDIASQLSVSAAAKGSRI